MARFHLLIDSATGQATRVPYTPEEEVEADALAAQAATAVQAETQTRTNGDTLRTRLDAALDANAAWLPQSAQNPTGRTAAPNLTQVVGQVDRLTREVNALIRLARGRLDDVAGT